MYSINNKSNLLKDFNGIILINKLPSGTSYDVIRRIKKIFFLKKLVMPVHWTL